MYCVRDLQVNSIFYLYSSDALWYKVGLAGQTTHKYKHPVKYMPLSQKVLN